MSWSISKICTSSHSYQGTIPLGPQANNRLSYNRKEPDEKPIKGIATDQAPSIPRKPKAEPPPKAVTTNGKSGANGVHATVSDAAKSLKRARSDDDDDVLEVKKAKTSQVDVPDDDVVIIEDEGAILIDD